VARKVSVLGELLVDQAVVVQAVLDQVVLDQVAVGQVAQVAATVLVVVKWPGQLGPHLAGAVGKNQVGMVQRVKTVAIQKSTTQVSLR